MSRSGMIPSFQWDIYPGAGIYTVILAKVRSVGFDLVIQEDDLILNTMPVDDPAWLTMPCGTWYWTVLAHDIHGNLLNTDFTIFEFTVACSGVTPVPEPASEAEPESASEPAPSPSGTCGTYVAPGNMETVWLLQPGGQG